MYQMILFKKEIMFLLDFHSKSEHSKNEIKV